MIFKNIENISLEDIKTLYNSLDRELKTVEFKRHLQLLTKENKKEFLADVSSFANSSGGDIIYGIDEQNGVVGFDVENIDKLILQIEQIIRSGIAPRVLYRIKEVKTEDGKWIVIIRIERSFFGPHQVIIFGWEKFWSRGESGKFKLDVYQLKDAFNYSEGIKQRINDFIIDRISRIYSDETPVRLSNKPKMIFHAIPIQNFANNDNLNIHSLTRKFSAISTIGKSDASFRKIINFDGIISYDLPDSAYHESYMQLFRNGSIESVDVSILGNGDLGNGEKIIPITLLEDTLLDTTQYLFNLLGVIEAKAPFLLFFNLINIRGYQFPRAFNSLYQTHLPSKPIRENELRFTEMMINNLGSPVKIFKDWFDNLWQAFGYEKSLNYISDNEWRANGKTRK